MSACVLFIVLFLSNSAKRCDKYVITQGDNVRGIGNQLYERFQTTISGCKKGCFDNNTYNEYGAKKCEKCSNIEDREFCEDFFTCQWTKSGKCKSASCPQMARNLSKNSDDRIEKFGNCIKTVEKILSNEVARCNRNFDSGWMSGCLSSYQNNQTYCNYLKENCLSETRSNVANGYYYSYPDWSSCHIGPNGDPSRGGSADNDRWSCGECYGNSCGGRRQCFELYGYEPPSALPTKFDHNYERKVCHSIYGCMYAKTQNRCAAWSVWAFVLVLVLSIVVVLVIIAVICILLLKMQTKNKVSVADKSASAPASVSKGSKDSPQTTTATASTADTSPREAGPYVVIKLGKQELKTKKVESAVWGENVVFNGLGPEDDDIEFELHDDEGALLGSADVRIPDYVNSKKRAKVDLKKDGTDIGMLEADIEIQVQEQPELKITGVLFVDKYLKV